MSGLRTFVGLPLTDPFADLLAAACARVRDLEPAWKGEKWVPRQNLHVTLRFIGDVGHDELDVLADAIASEVGECEGPFSLPFEGLRPVQSLRHVRMLWATFLDPEGSCAALASAVERAALAFGVEPDERQFVPHVTLVRARKPHALSERAFEAGQAVVSEAPASMSVTRATLFSSTLTPTGPIYTELRSYPFDSD